MDSSENNPSWSFVLGFNQVHSYLSPFELTELNLVSQYVHLKLKPEIFKTFNLFNYLQVNNFTSLLNQFNSVDSIDITEFDQLIDDIQSIQNFITHLYLEYDSFDYLKLSVTHYLKNIQYLKLYWLNITLDDYNRVIDELKLLEELDFKEVNFLFSASASKSGNIVKFPSRLKNLYLFRCQWVNSDLCGDDSLTYYYDHDDSQIDFTPISSSSDQHLPHLERFVCYSKHISYTEIINNFLSKNPQLIHCELEGYLFNQITFNCLKDCKQLISLKLDFKTHNSRGNENLRIVPFNSVKQFTLSGTYLYGIPRNQDFCSSCPNTTKLSLDYDSAYTACFNDIISSFKHLDTLIINNIGKSDDFKSVEFTNLDLIYLELRGFHPLKIDLNSLDQCSELRHISINNPYFQFEDKEQKVQSYYNQFQGWKYFIYMESIQCYRI